MYIISRCLLGYDCKYDGGNNKNDEVIEFCKTHDYVTICPETDAGLGSPRPPAEIVEGADGETRVIDCTGTDLTESFVKGAKRSLDTVISGLKERGRDAVIEGAVLKANSPSCGHGVIYDGTFSRNKTEGDGIFTRMLVKTFGEEGLLITDENGVSKLINR